MNPKPPQSARWPLVLAAVLLLAPVLYVLSVGPAQWLYSSGVISESTFDMLAFNVYAPLWWLSGRSPSFSNAIGSYIDWWLPPV